MKKPRRNGAALIVVLLFMGVLTVILSVVTLQIYGQRNVVRQRTRQLQAEWLARAGVEMAAARLLTNPAAFGEENSDLSPDAKVRIAVVKSEDSYLVTVEAQVGQKDERPVLRTRTQRFRRSDKDGVIILQSLEMREKTN